MDWPFLLLLFAFLILLILHVISQPRKRACMSRSCKKTIGKTQKLEHIDNTNSTLSKCYLASYFPIKIIGSLDFESNIRNLINNTGGDAENYVGTSKIRMNKDGDLIVFIDAKRMGTISKLDREILLARTPTLDFTQTNIVAPILIFNKSINDDGSEATYECRLGNAISII